MLDLTKEQIQEQITTKGIMGEHIDPVGLAKQLFEMLELMKFLTKHLPNKKENPALETIRILEEKDITLAEFIALINTGTHAYIQIQDTDRCLQLANQYRINKALPFQLLPVMPPAVPMPPKTNI